MSSFKFVDVIKQLTEANKKLSEELVFIRERMKMFTEFKFIFDLNSNKIKQSLDSNEWQKFEKVLTKINEIRDIRDTSNDNCVLDVNTGQTQPQQPQEVSHPLMIVLIIIMCFQFRRTKKSYKKLTKDQMNRNRRES